MNKRITLIASLFVLAISTRFLPHAPNFTALAAIALFGGAMISNRAMAFAIPLLSLYVSDLIINNIVYGSYYSEFVWYTADTIPVYLSFALMVLMGRGIKNFKISSIAIPAVASTVVFFLITNFALFYPISLYPHNTNGIIMAYEAGLPYALNQLGSTVLYSAILFGSAYFSLGSPKETRVILA